MVFSCDLINFWRIKWALSVTDFQSTMSNHVPWLALKRAERFPWRLASTTSTMFLSYFTPFRPRGSPRVLIFFSLPSSIHRSQTRPSIKDAVQSFAFSPRNLLKKPQKQGLWNLWAFYWLIHKSRAWLSRVTGPLSQFHGEDSCLEFDISLLWRH